MSGIPVVVVAKGGIPVRQVSEKAPVLSASDSGVAITFNELGTPFVIRDNRTPASLIFSGNGTLEASGINGLPAHMLPLGDFRITNADNYGLFVKDGPIWVYDSGRISDQAGIGMLKSDKGEWPITWTGAPVSFDPSDLFTASTDRGLIWAAWEPNTLYANAARTNPAGVGQYVTSIANRAPNDTGTGITSETDEKRAQLQNDAEFGRYLFMTGDDRYLRANTNLGGSSSVTVIAAVRRSTGATDAQGNNIISFGNVATSNNSFGLFMKFGSETSRYQFASRGTTNTVSVVPGTNINSNNIVCARSINDGTTVSNQIRSGNGSWNSNSFSQGAITSFGTATLSIGQLSDFEAALNRLYGMVVINRYLNDQDCQRVIDWFARNTGIGLTE